MYIKTEISPSQSKKPEIVFVIGGPASGKGTQCGFLERDRMYHHISVGDLVRKLFKENNSDRKMLEVLKQSLKRGDLLDDQLSIKLVIEEMNKHPEVIGFLIDGCPRTMEQLRLFETTIRPCDRVLYLESSEEDMKKRALNRSNVLHRPDDHDDAIMRRIRLYKEETMPVILYLKTKKDINFYTIISSDSIGNIAKLIKDIFDIQPVATLGFFDSNPTQLNKHSKNNQSPKIASAKDCSPVVPKEPEKLFFQSIINNYIEEKKETEYQFRSRS